MQKRVFRVGCLPLRAALVGTLRAVVLFAALLTATIVQADDFGLWGNVDITQDIGQTPLSVDLGLGMRANNNVGSLSRWNINVGLDYTPMKWLKIGAGYNMIRSYSLSSRSEKISTAEDGTTTWKGYNMDHSYWRNKDRFYVDVRGKLKIGRFGLALRERYQATIFEGVWVTEDKYRYNTEYDLDGQATYVLRDGYPTSELEEKSHKTKHALRSRLSLDYNIPKCPLTPEASFEVSNNLRDGFSTEKRRYSVGLDWKIKKRIHLIGTYIYSNGDDSDDDSNLHAIELTLSLKNPF